MGVVKVVNRQGAEEVFDLSKVRGMVEKYAEGLEVDTAELCNTVKNGVFNGITTEKIGDLLARSAAYMASQHPDHGMLGGRIAIAMLHRCTKASLLDTFADLHNCVTVSGEKAPLVTDNLLRLAHEHEKILTKVIDYHRDFNFDYFGYKTLEKSYLLRIAGNIAERPQHMLMRVALGIHGADIPRVVETYEMMSKGWFIHATPTLFYAGTPTPQLSSCYLVGVKEDSIDGIYDTLKTTALICKHAGGVGLHIHNVRSAGSYIRGINGEAKGVIPMLRVYNSTARYVDQGGGRRKGAIAVYLEPWHPDIIDFLHLRRGTGKEEMRGRDLFYALWIPDLFMKRVEADGSWSLFDPAVAPGLADTWGDDFERLYTGYEAKGVAHTVVRAHQIWFAMLESQVETGTPYMLYKDSANRKSNQKHLGTIKGSNLCTEIIEYTSPNEVAVCNLASIALPKFVANGTVAFDHSKLADVAGMLTINLNRVIDVGYYPVPEAKNSNLRHRPIGIGVQGLWDTFVLLRLPYDSPEAKQLNADIFETIYYGALRASIDLARLHGPYESYAGSPASQGILQFDMWGVHPSPRWDWDALRRDLRKHGLRNSLLVAPMPTASTSQILGNTECFEPTTSNFFVRRVLSGEFPVINRHLVRDLCAAGLWTPVLRAKIMAANGSVQDIPEIPSALRTLYRTVWEIKQRDIIDMAAARAVRR